MTELRNDIQVPGDWHAADFHIHTPASPDFEGPFKHQKEKVDQAYIWVLEKAFEADLKIIVITDHNEVAGYEKISSLEDELKNTKRTLLRSELPIPDSIQSQLDLFEKITILPGVELDIDPNLHILVLFDPKLSTKEMDDFLVSAGYPKEVRGLDEAARNSKWNFNDVCREAGKLNSIVIAAHVDSNKGLYEVSKQWGQKRIASFVDENLYALEFINPKSRDQIENILKQPNYSRETKLAFIQSSDFHGKYDQTIGSRRTWVRLDLEKWDKEIVFDALKRAFRNPDEYVSAPGRPEIKEIQKRLEDSPYITNGASLS